MQKHVLVTDLKIGNIFTKEMKVKNREALIVESKPEDEEFIIAKSRVDDSIKKITTKKKMWVTLLHESDALNDGDTGSLF